MEMAPHLQAVDLMGSEECISDITSVVYTLLKLNDVPYMGCVHDHDHHSRSHITEANVRDNIPRLALCLVVFPSGTLPRLSSRDCKFWMSQKEYLLSPPARRAARPTRHLRHT